MICRAKHLANLSAVLLTFGCGFNDGDANPRTGVFALASTSAWAGDTIKVYAADFRYADDDASILLDGDSLAVVRINDTTLGGVIPDTVGGLLPVTVLYEGASLSLGSATVFGYTGEQQHPFQFSDQMLRYPRGAWATLMGIAHISGPGLTLLNLDTGSGSVLPIGNWDGLHAPGPSPDPNVFLLRDEFNGTLRSYQLPGGAVREDSLPAVGNHYLMQLNDSSWLTAGGQSFWVTPQEPISGSGNGVVPSPRGDRATLNVALGPDTELPVFNTATGAVAYRLGFGESVDASFSEDGALLVVVGHQGAQPGYRVMLVDAADGTVQGDTIVAGVSFSATIDPVRPYVYVAGLQDNLRPEILVFNQDGLRLEHRLRAPARAAACSYNCWHGIVLNGANNTLHVAASISPATTTSDWRYLLPPTP